jgi:hypothetical protein
VAEDLTISMGGSPGGKLGRIALKPGSQFIEISNLCGARGSNDGTSVPAIEHQAFRFEPTQCFSNWCPGQRQISAERLFHQTTTWRV